MDADIHLDFLDERAVGTADDGNGRVGSVERHQANSVEEGVAATSVACYGGDAEQFEAGMVESHEQRHSIVVTGSQSSHTDLI